MKVFISWSGDSPLYKKHRYYFANDLTREGRIAVVMDEMQRALPAWTNIAVARNLAGLMHDELNQPFQGGYTDCRFCLMISF